MTDLPDRLIAALADRYTLERALGQGGMATVYLAEDLKHKRKVAVKVLRPELAAVLGAERFVQEITTTASLQHPHILPLFDSGEAGGFLYYVMPWIEGETLRDRLNRETQLDIAEAVRIAREVADALDYAHRQGVIHRDIKPENILLHDGRPMVADFGIALALSAAAGGRMTETGMSLGTPHYMSPEQATAEKDLTSRSDTYSLGSVLYEMLTGEPPHLGNSAQAIIMKIVTEDAEPVTKLRKSVPPNVAAAVAKALERLPADRFETAKAFAEALANPSFTTMTTAGAPAFASTRPRVLASTLIPSFVIIVALAVVAVLGWTRKPDKPVLRVAVNFSPAQALQFTATRRFSLSRDGKRLVYIGPDTSGTQLWVRDLDALSGRPLPGTADAQAPFFSPDGESVAYLTGTPGDLRVVSLAGGPPVAVVRDSAMPWGGSWGDDGMIYYTNAHNLIARVNQSGGVPEVFSRLDSAREEREHDWPQVLPGSKFVLMQVWRGSTADADMGVLDLRTHEVTTVQRATYAQYVDGYLIFTGANGTLFAEPFDAEHGRTTGPAIPASEQVQVDQYSAAAQFSVADNGLMAYLPGGEEGSQQIVWVDRAGGMTPVDTTWRGNFVTLDLSPDGQQLAVTQVSNDGEQIMVRRMPHGPMSRLTYDGTTNQRPVWTPDGRRIAFISNRNGGGHFPWVQRADGSAPASRLLTTAEQVDEVEWVRDGSGYLYRTGSLGANTRDIWYRAAGDTTSRAVTAGVSDEFGPAVSPDGRWFAYSSSESGKDEVFVRRMDDPGAGRTQVSTAGGDEPRWAHSGRELFYRTPRGELMAVPVTTTRGEFHAGTPRRLFVATDMGIDSYHHAYVVGPDDQRFLMIRGNAGAALDVVLVVNWLEELKQKRP